VSEPGSRRALFACRVALSVLSLVVADCGGCGQNHVLPDVDAAPDAPADASVACQWQLGEGRRLPHAASISSWSAQGPGVPSVDSGAWVTSGEDGGAWLHHLDVNGDDLAAPSLVDSNGRFGSASILRGRDGGGLIIYRGCPPAGESCDSNRPAFVGYEQLALPKLRAFDGDGTLGPVRYVDVTQDLAINEHMFGSAAGDGFLVVVPNVVPAQNLVQAVSARGELLGPPMRGLFRTEIFGGFPVEPSSAAFVLRSREDGTVWLATFDNTGRPRGEVRSQLRFGQREFLSRMAIGSTGEHVVVTTLDGIYAMTPAGELEWSRATPRSFQRPTLVGETLFLLSTQDFDRPRHWELLRLGDMGAVEESIELGDLAFNNRDNVQGLKGMVSTGDGLLLFEYVRLPYGEPDRDPHVNVYPVRCLPPPSAGDGG